MARDFPVVPAVCPSRDQLASQPWFATCALYSIAFWIALPLASTSETLIASTRLPCPVVPAVAALVWFALLETSSC